MTIVKKVNISPLSRTIYPTIIYAHHKNINVVSFHTIIQSCKLTAVGGLGEKCSLIYLYLYFVLRWPGCGGRVSAVVRPGAGRSPRSFLGKASAQSSSGVRVQRLPPSSHTSHGSTADTEIVPPPRPCHILTLRR